MGSWTRLAVVIGFCAALCGCGPHERQADEWTGVAAPDVLQGAGLQYYWHTSVPLRKGETIVRLRRLDENLYCFTNRNRIIAVSASTGVEKWSRKLADVHQTVFRPVHVDKVTLLTPAAADGEGALPPGPQLPPTVDAVMINTLSSLLVLDRQNGQEMQLARLSPAASAAGATDGEHFFVGTDRGRYYALRLQKPVKLWTQSAAGSISAPLEYFAGRLYIASTDGEFSAIAVVARPTKGWHQSTGGSITAAFHVDNRGCFVGSHDNRIHAFDPFTGRMLWEPFVCKRSLVDPIQVGDNSIFQLSRGDRFYAVALTTGRQRWSRENGRLVLALMNGDVYLLDGDGNLEIVDEILGETKQTVPMTGLDVFAPNAMASAIYAATKNGRLFCIRLLKAGYLTVEMLKNRR